jgi:DNA invertase Pin-like site-specific DNA recombinase
MIAAIYVRVSKEEQHLNQQLDDLKNYAKKMEWDYIIFKEKESTRKTRPVKQEVMQMCRERKFDILLVWKLDRFARSVREMIVDVAELEAKGVSFVSLKDGIDFSTPAGRLQFHILTAFAQFERDLISERTKAGLRKAKNVGKRGKDKKKRKKRSK